MKPPMQAESDFIGKTYPHLSAFAHAIVQAGGTMHWNETPVSATLPDGRRVIFRAVEPGLYPACTCYEAPHA